MLRPRSPRGARIRGGFLATRVKRETLGKVRSGAGAVTPDHAAWRLAERAYACCGAKSQGGAGPLETVRANAPGKETGGHSMALGRLWAGKAYGTNIGNLFVTFDERDGALTGTLRINDVGVGLYSYSIAGSFDGTRLTFKGQPLTQIEGAVFGQLTAIASLNQKGELEGEWETDIGSGGTFILFPHDRREGTPESTPDQLHTARHHFGAIEINREQITSLAEDIQRDFIKSQVVITVVSGTEQSRFLRDFKDLSLGGERAEIIKIFAQEPEAGLNRIVSIEFGPQVNSAMTQGPSEAWVLGKLEKLKRDLRQFERSYTTNFKRLGFGINQLLLVAAIVLLPSLATLRDRVVFIAGVLGLVFLVNWLHSRYLPFAAIYLGKKPISFFTRVSPSVFSWVITSTAGIVATLLAAYLQGWLNLPAFPE